VLQPLRRFYDNEAAELRVELGVGNKNRAETRECHLTLRMPGARTIQIEETTSDPYGSLDLAAARLMRTAKKELQRMRRPSGHRKEHPLATSPTDGKFEELPLERPARAKKRR
jgi:ribosome-associated translation inhibitor RaiA